MNAASVIIDILVVILVIVLLAFLASFLLIKMYFTRPRNQDMDRVSQPKEALKNPLYREYLVKNVEGTRYFRSLNPEDVEITSFDNLKLRGYFIPAAEATGNTIICVHGFRANGLYDFGAKAKFLRNTGWNLLMVDDRAHGRSEGINIGFSVTDSRDVLKWIEFVNDRFGKDSKIVLHGVSMGAATILSAAGDLDCPENVKGVIADCGFSSGWEELKYQVGHLAHMPVFPLAYFCLFWHYIICRYHLKDYAPMDVIGNFKGHLLVIHGAKDSVVPVEMSSVIFDAADCDKDILITEDADHVLSYLVNTEAYEKAFSRILEKVISK